jgi:hypothetical protein
VLTSKDEFIEVPKNEGLVTLSILFGDNRKLLEIKPPWLNFYGLYHTYYDPPFTLYYYPTFGEKTSCVYTSIGTSTLESSIWMKGLGFFMII